MPEQPMRIRGDFAWLAQVLANLLNNAAKYTDRKDRLSLTAEQEGSEVVFRVRDSGIGIPTSAALRPRAPPERTYPIVYDYQCNMINKFELSSLPRDHSLRGIDQPTESKPCPIIAIDFPTMRGSGCPRFHCASAATATGRR